MSNTPMNVKIDTKTSDQLVNLSDLKKILSELIKNETDVLTKKIDDLETQVVHLSDINNNVIKILTKYESTGLVNKLNFEAGEDSDNDSISIGESDDALNEIIAFKGNSNRKTTKRIKRKQFHRHSKSVKGKLIKSESTSSDAPHTTEKPHKASLLYSKHLKYLGIALILIMVIVIIASTVILSTNNSGSVTTKNPDTSDYVATTTKPSDTSNHVDDNVTIGPVGPGAILDRKKWGGRDALNFTVPLKHPTPFVIISHTATPFCKNFAECSKRVRSIQEYHVSLKSPDIGYNFLIGGDGNAYVGRGWDIRNFHTANSIGINFIGNYIYDHLTPNMIKIAKFLLEEGLQQGKLSTDYKLIGHNQTFATLSPGTNVYEVIKTWPHFDPETYLPA